MKQAAIDILSAISHAFGPATAEPQLVRTPDNRHSLLVLKDGYKATSYANPPVNRVKHQFSCVRTFCEWLRMRAPVATSVDILLDNDGAVRAYLSPHAVDGDEVLCRISVHPARQALLDAIMGKMNQAQTVQALQMLAPYVSGEIPGPVLIAEVAKLRAAATQNFEFAYNPRGYQEYSFVAKGTKVEGRIPETFTVSLPWWLGVSFPATPAGNEAVYDVEVSLTMELTEQGPMFELSAPLLTLQHEASLNDVTTFMLELLNDASAIDAKFHVFRGKGCIEQIVSHSTSL